MSFELYNLLVQEKNSLKADDFSISRTENKIIIVNRCTITIDKNLNIEVDGRPIKYPGITAYDKIVNLFRKSVYPTRFYLTIKDFIDSLGWVTIKISKFKSLVERQSLRVEIGPLIISMGDISRSIFTTVMFIHKKKDGEPGILQCESKFLEEETTPQQLIVNTIKKYFKIPGFQDYLSSKEYLPIPEDSDSLSSLVISIVNQNNQLLSMKK